MPVIAGGACVQDAHVDQAGDPIGVGGRQVFLDAAGRVALTVEDDPQVVMWKLGASAASIFTCSGRRRLRVIWLAASWLPVTMTTCTPWPASSSIWSEEPARAVVKASPS